VGQSYFGFTMSPNTPVAFAIQNAARSNSYAGILTVYTAVGGLPNPADAGSYNLVSTCNFTALTAAGPQPSAIYLPGSVCPITSESLESGCQVVMGMSMDATYLQYTLTTMVTAQALTEGLSVIGTASSTNAAYYQLPVPPVPGTISLAIRCLRVVCLNETWVTWASVSMKRTIHR
jgi:hypothetical protein